MRPCPQGHDIELVGRDSNSNCRQCQRDRHSARSERVAAAKRERYDAMTGEEYSHWLLRQRRQKALRRRAEREQRSNQEA